MAVSWYVSKSIPLLILLTFHVWGSLWSSMVYDPLQVSWAPLPVVAIHSELWVVRGKWLVGPHVTLMKVTLCLQGAICIPESPRLESPDAASKAVLGDMPSCGSIPWRCERMLNCKGPLYCEQNGVLTVEVCLSAELPWRRWYSV